MAAKPKLSKKGRRIFAGVFLWAYVMLNILPFLVTVTVVPMLLRFSPNGDLAEWLEDVLCEPKAELTFRFHTNYKNSGQSFVAECSGDSSDYGFHIYGISMAASQVPIVAFMGLTAMLVVPPIRRRWPAKLG